MTQAKYEPGELVLVRNMAIETSHDRKHKPRYLGPYEVFKRMKGGNYKLKELDGAILYYKYAAFRILPYITRNHKFMQEDHDWEDKNDRSETEFQTETDHDNSDSED